MRYARFGTLFHTLRHLTLPLAFSRNMAWRCTGNTNAELIRNMQRASLIESDTVAEAFKKVDRKNYVLDKRDAYIDSPQ